MQKIFDKDYSIALTLILVILASTYDLLADLGEGAEASHLIQEGIILTVATIGLFWILQSIRQQSRDIATLNQQLEEAKNLPIINNSHLAEVRKNLSESIAEQFQQWELSKSEKEVGQFLLKGLSLKEIAMIRGTAEKTIRQQASSIYQKAGVTGRHAFSAWFIEDFL